MHVAGTDSQRPFDSPVLVAGGGVAGMAAALDLARLGIPALLVERESFLGGQVLRLDKLYPTDHCGFCPVWTQARACLDHPLVTVRRHAVLEGIDPPESPGGPALARITTRIPAVDPEACVFCGLCLTACAERGVPGALRDHPEARTANHPADPASPPCPAIDFARCSRCGACVAACPTGAIDLDRAPASERIPVAEAVFATGFAESARPLAPEFGLGAHPDVLTALEFEALSAESGPGGGALARPSSGQPPRSLAFIQCAGSRDQRFLPYCSGVCCMHALKQARWAKRRHPELSCAIFFTDLRAVGKGYEAYARAARDEGVLLLHSRPGLVFAPEGGPPDGAVAVRYEDPDTGRALTAEFDLVVVNGGLEGCPLPGAAPSGPLAATERACGFCQEPGDVAASVVQGSRAAALAALRLGLKPGREVRP